MKRKIEICENCDKFYSFATCRKTVCRVAGGELTDPFLREKNMPFEERLVPEKCVYYAEQLIANLNDERR